MNVFAHSRSFGLLRLAALFGMTVEELFAGMHDDGKQTALPRMERLRDQLKFQGRMGRQRLESWRHF
jgi:hypothetical protein